MTRNTFTAAAVALLMLTSCASDGTSEFADTFVAVARGQVTRNGDPVAGLTVRADVFTTTCPSSALQQTSTQSTQTEADGSYRLVLNSSSSEAGQCLVLNPAGAPPVLHTLNETPFSVKYPGPATDSVEIDLTLP
jgi:hypothetical protein